MLDRAACDRARIARDARFDGRFFSGVLTTRIYCRPVCPVRPARSRNVVFFPSAAAAEGAGFRPCLRCRPEAAPGSPAWRGTAATVSRALRLIDRGALDEGSVAELAAALGVGPRHLTRLFLEHVGASPSAAARTRRVQLAKTLLSDTRLAITDVAFAAGFQSIRRFNTVFREVYRRAPSSIRRLRPGAAIQGDAITLRLAFCPPLGWRTSARLFAGECTSGVEEVGPQGYRRTIVVDGRAGWFSVRPVPGQSQIELHLWLPDYQPLRVVIERVSRMFDLSADPESIARQLAADGALAPWLGRLRGVRLPGAWDGFEVAVHRMVRRDVGDPAAAATVVARLARAHGRPLAPRPARGPALLFPEPAALARSAPRVLGLSRAGARSLRRLAEGVAAGAIQFQSATFDDLVGQLTREAGFDAPTANWIAMRSLGEPDAAPFDLPSSPARVSRELPREPDRERWRPWRSYVAVCQASAGRAGLDVPARERPA